MAVKADVWREEEHVADDLSLGRLASSCLSSAGRLKGHRTTVLVLV